MEYWYLPNLYSFLKYLEITTIVNNVSRYVIDPNNDKLSCFNKIYLIDLHSFGKDIDTNIVLGNRNGQTLNKEFTMSIKNTSEKLDFIVSLNNPYSGGYITRKYANNKVETLQLELSYKKYIDDKTFGNEEFPKINKTLFTKTQEKLKCFFESLFTYNSIFSKTYIF